MEKEERAGIEGEEDQRFNDFLAWERASRDTIDFKKIYVDITGDLIAGLLLSQIVYWYLPDKEGKTKLRVMKRGILCLAKTRFEWWDEIRFNPTQVDKGLKILRKKGIIRTKVHRFNGTPTIHIFLLKKTLLKLINKELKEPKKNPKLENTNFQISKLEYGNEQKLTSITETTTEITNRDYKDNVSEKIESLFKSFKIPKKDKAIWKALNNDNPEYLLRQLVYAYDKRKTIKQPVKFIQSALDHDYAFTDQAAAEKREQEWKGLKGDFTQLGFEKGIIENMDDVSSDNIERNRQRALMAARQ